MFLDSLLRLLFGAGYGIVCFLAFVELSRSSAYWVYLGLLPGVTFGTEETELGSLRVEVFPILGRIFPELGKLGLRK